MIKRFFSVELVVSGKAWLPSDGVEVRCSGLDSEPGLWQFGVVPQTKTFRFIRK